MRDVNAETLKRWIEAREVDIVDVREPAEYASGHIAGARSIPLSGLRKADLPGAGKLVLVCATGRRSVTGCDALSVSTGRKVYSLEGGIAAWRAADGELEGDGRPVLPIDRQVLVAAGLLVLFGVILSQLVHPSLIWITTFVGAGLVFAGTTGFCGMALLLAKAPWNQRSAQA